MLESRPLKVLFLVRSLGYGGAERQLVELAQTLSARGFDISVACFYAGGALERELEQTMVRLISLGKKARWDLLGFVAHLVDVVHSIGPDILHSYLVEPNLVAALLRPRFPSLKIVWGVRASNMDFSRYGLTSRLSFAATVALSRVPDLMIANSKSGAEYHVARGYPAKRIRIVPNGIDTSRFRPDPGARRKIRKELSIDDSMLLIGQIGRIDVMKDHRNFLRAAALFRERTPSVRFVCVGSGDPIYERQMRMYATELGLDQALTWLAARTDTQGIYCACDLVTNTSAFGEGFPNVVAEAMACGVPCVVTDVGDSSFVVEDTGIVVPPGRSDLLACAWEELVARRSESVSIACRKRITENFSLELLADRTIAALEHILA